MDSNHLLVMLHAGVSKIYVYDHGSAIPLEAALAPLVAGGRVVVEHFQGNHQRFQGTRSLDFSSTAQVGGIAAVSLAEAWSRQLLMPIAR